MRHPRFTSNTKIKLLSGVMLVVVVCALVETASRGGWLNSADNWYYDAWHQLTGSRYSSEHVILVVVDDQTRLEHADEPLVFWGPYFARAIETARRAGAKDIAIDYLFSVSAESWLRRLQLPDTLESRVHDSPLREQLASGQVILAANMVSDKNGNRKVVLPLADYWGVLPQRLDDLGLTNFFSDPDGVIRRYVWALPDDKGEVWVTFARLLAERNAGREIENEISAPRLINYAGPPGSIPRVSFSRLLSPDAQTDSQVVGLKNKIVIIGSEFSGQQDKASTPYSRSLPGVHGRMMTGAELHANIVETMLAGHALRPVPAVPATACLAVILALGTVLFFRLSPLPGLGTAALLGTATALCGYLSFRSFWVFNAAGPQLGLAMAYFGTLALRLVSGEREKKRIKQVFGRYVSDELVERLLSAGWQPDLGGKAVQATVLFADIRDFTSISELLNPHELVEMLNAFFGRVCQSILDQGGAVDKYIGDCVMAVFGSLAPQPDHCRRAVRAALAMADTAKAFSPWVEQRFAGRGLPEFRIGIGLHTGEVVSGNIGSPKRMDFTSIGDTVNLASRLEGCTKAVGWTIAASGEVIVSAGRGVIVGRCETIEVKGYSKALEVYELLGLEPD